MGSTQLQAIKRASKTAEWRSESWTKKTQLLSGVISLSRTDAFHSPGNSPAVLVEEHLCCREARGSNGVSPGHRASEASFESGTLVEDCMLADTGGVVLAADLRM